MPLIHNRGRLIGGEGNQKTVARTIIYPKGWDKDGAVLKEGKKTLDDTLKPGEHKKVTDEQFKFLKSMFHGEIVNLDDLNDMRAQFQESEAAAPRPGYVAPEDVDALVAKRVAEELAKARKDTEDAKSDGAPQKSRALPESHDDLVKVLDAMDRGDLIATIENYGLELDHKNFKKLGDLKAAILAAVENKKAAA